MSENNINPDFTVDDMSDPKMRVLYEYWLSIKGDKFLPSRADFEPTKVPQALTHITIINVEEDPRRYKLVLVGSENVKAFGSEVTGKYLDEIPLLHKHVNDRYDWLVDNKRPYIYHGQLLWSEKTFLDYNMLGLPLSSNGTDVDKLIFAGFYFFPKNI